jgi:hypothetical protein
MHRRPRLALALAALCASFAVAQNYTAHPIDSLHAVSGQIIPLAAGGVNFDESRTQHLILAPFLPSSPAVLSGIAVSPHVVGSVPYQSLTITVSLTTASTLSTTFAANLPNPQIAFQQNAFSLAFPSSSTWYPINFQNPIQYDGISNLVIEFQKVIDRPNNPTIATVSHQLVSFPTRTDLPGGIWTFGIYGSGASTAPTATTTTGGKLLLRCLWGTGRTLTIASTRITSPSRNYFHLGATATVTVQGLPGEQFINTIDVALLGTPVIVPPIVGNYWLPSFFNVFFIGILDGSGRGPLPIVIPNEMALVGIHVYFQSITAGAGIVFTNVADAIIAL